MTRISVCFMSLQRPMDKITSVAIPLTLAPSSVYMFIWLRNCVFWFSMLKIASFLEGELDVVKHIGVGFIGHGTPEAKR
ncbi:hypothetical protein AtNW77_Chr2g0222211 [Arabidopsis thaliana]